MSSIVLPRTLAEPKMTEFSRIMAKIRKNQEKAIASITVNIPQTRRGDILKKVVWRNEATQKIIAKSELLLKKLKAVQARDAAWKTDNPAVFYAAFKAAQQAM